MTRIVWARPFPAALPTPGPYPASGAKSAPFSRCSACSREALSGPRRERFHGRARHPLRCGAMDGSAPFETTALELAARLRRREISSLELTRAAFRSIAERDPAIGAFVELDERRALRAADEADRRLRK